MYFREFDEMLNSDRLWASLIRTVLVVFSYSNNIVQERFQALAVDEGLNLIVRFDTDTSIVFVVRRGFRLMLGSCCVSTDCSGSGSNIERLEVILVRPPDGDDINLLLWSVTLFPKST